MPSHVVIDNLSFEVEGKSILDGISLDLNITRLGVVGRNGSGKSTFARLLAGLIAPSAGSIRVNTHDVCRDRKAALGEVGILFQNPDHQIIFPTVGEEIAFGLEQLGRTKEDVASEVMDILTRFDLAHWKDAYIATLSQGQKHLVCLMSIIAMNPKLLILDEPFAGLDIPTRAQLGRYLAQYEGSLIHISHRPDDLGDYDDLIWIDSGRIKEMGAFDDVMALYLRDMNAQGESDDLADLTD